MKSSLLKLTAKHFKVLGHAKRLEIVCLLQGHNLTVNQIVQMTGLRQAAVSQHLMLFKEAGIVCTHQIGKEVYYSLCLTMLSTLTDFIKNLTKLEPQEDAEPTVIDPICHMHLTPSTACLTTDYNGVRHYFCGKGCLKEFHASH
ncbi:MAG: metalloregulator ArsR/SmtB family transcription factor [Microgenomates group bacterium]